MAISRKGPPFGVARLQVERVRLAGAAGHPEEDARPLAARVRGGLCRQRGQPAGRENPGGGGHAAAQPVAAGKQVQGRHEFTFGGVNGSA